MDKKLLGGIGGGLGVIALTAATFFAVTGGVLPSPTPAPTAVSVYEINGLADAPPKPTPTPTPTPVAPPAPEPVVEAPAGPDLCPPGTTSQGSDGYNDLACAPDVCLTLRGIPDPAYPECDYFYEPSYYR